MKNIQVFLDIWKKCSIMFIEGKMSLYGVWLFDGLCGQLEKEGDSDDYIAGKNTADQSSASALGKR